MVAIPPLKVSIAQDLHLDMATNISLSHDSPFDSVHTFPSAT